MATMEHPVLSTIAALTAQHRALARHVVDAGLAVPCPNCGLTSLVTCYDRLTLAAALNGHVSIDPAPTHLCVPTPPRETTRRVVVDIDAVTADVVDQWS